MLEQSLPPCVHSLLEKHGLAGQPLLCTAAADLSFAGRFEPHWLVLTEKHVAVFAAGPTPYLLTSVATDTVESFRSCATLGSGWLQARIGGVWVDLLRYSNTLAQRFAKVANKLEEFRNEGRFRASAADEADERRCPSCGLALSFAGDVCPRCIDRGAVLSRVWSLMRPYRLPALMMCLLVLLGVVVELAPPKLQQYLVDHVLQVDGRGGRADDLVAVLLVIVGSLAGTRLVLCLVNMCKGVLANRVGTAMTSDLRGRMVEKLHKLSVDYYDRQPVGVLMSRVAHDTEALYGLIHQFTSGFLLQILQVIGVGVMLFTLNAKLALWTLVPMPLVLYGSWFFWRYVYPQYHRYWDAASKQAGALAGMLAGLPRSSASTNVSRQPATG